MTPAVVLLPLCVCPHQYCTSHMTSTRTRSMLLCLVAFYFVSLLFPFLMTMVNKAVPCARLEHHAVTLL